MAYRSCGIAKYLNKEVLVYPSSFTGDFEKNRFQPIRVSMEGSVFKEAGASISVVDLGADYMERTENSGAKTLIAKYTSQPTDNYLGGLWTIELPNYGISYQYLLSNATNKIEKKGKTFEDYVGVQGLEKRGKKKWRASVADVLERMRAALEPDEIVLGGGNAKLLKELPPNTRLGDDWAAFTGGFKLWQDMLPATVAQTPKVIRI